MPGNGKSLYVAFAQQIEGGRNDFRPWAELLLVLNKVGQYSSAFHALCLADSSVFITNSSKLALLSGEILGLYSP